MYRYNENDRTLVRERARQYRGQVERHRAGELSDEEFKHLRLRNGLYRQRHAHMLRVAIPYGLLSSTQMRMLAHIARTYDRGFGHFTTRQNIQFNWPELADTPDILDQLASVDMHAIQTSGNAVRNITADHLAGVAADELEDPRPYCELMRQWSTLHPEFSWLPRKFKIAFSGAAEDRAAIRFHDIGFLLVENDAGERGLEVFVGGGMGRTPVVGKVIRAFLPCRHLLSYTEAILRIYNLLGRRDNIHKARIKILVNALGLDAFRARVEEEWRRIKDGRLLLGEERVDAMRSHFPPPPYQDLPDAGATLDALGASHPGFASWLRHNTARHKVRGYRIATLSLKAPGAPPGDATDAQMEAVAELAERFSFGEIRVTHEQNLLLADVRQRDLFALWQALRPAGLATANAGTLTDMICCPGLDFCSLANAGTLAIAEQINDAFDAYDHLYDLGEIRLKMSGCMNACGHHHVGDIGILGVDKNGVEWYQLTLGGRPGNDAAIGTRLGPAIAKEQVAATIERILAVYVDLREPGERFIDTFRRVGMAPFKEHAYADHSKSSGRERRLAVCA